MNRPLFYKVEKDAWLFNPTKPGPEEEAKGEADDCMPILSPIRASST